MQHPTKRFINHPMFSTLRRWNNEEVGKEFSPPDLEITIAAMNQAHIRKGHICSWQNQEGVLISNTEVADFINEYPDGFIGIPSVPFHRPVLAVKELRSFVRNYGFKGLRIVQWHWNLPPIHAYYFYMQNAWI